MSKDKTLADRAKLVGIKWDNDERQWTGTLDSDGEPMRFWLSSAQLIDYLDGPRVPAGSAQAESERAMQGAAA